MNYELIKLNCHNCLFCLALSVFILSGCSKNSNSKQSSEDPNWVFLSGGTYMMGSPEGQGHPREYPMHKEEIDDFYIMKTEVTVAQYQECVEAGICWHNVENIGPLCNGNKENMSDHPINCVSWYQASAYCAWIGARLPSEAEWEYAARSGGKDILFPWGNEEPTCEHAAFDEKPAINCGKWKGSTAPVCSHPKGNSAQGVCDLSGNVIEWCYDWYYRRYNHRDNQPVPKPVNGATGKEEYLRIMRGGGLGSDEPLRARTRIAHAPEFAYPGLGIRCAK